MLTEEMARLVADAKPRGWVMEPEAKRLMALAGLDVPRFTVASGYDDALSFAKLVGFPVVAKVVSPRVVHKSEVGGVTAGIEGPGALEEAFGRLSAIDGCEGWCSWRRRRAGSS